MTTSVPMNQALALEKFRKQDWWRIIFLFFPFDNYGFHPSDLNFANIDQLHFWCFSVMFSSSTTFHSSLLESTSIEEKSLCNIFEMMLSIGAKKPTKRQRSELESFFATSFQNITSNYVNNLKITLSRIIFQTIKKLPENMLSKL